MKSKTITYKLAMCFLGGFAVEQSHAVVLQSIKQPTEISAPNGRSANFRTPGQQPLHVLSATPLQQFSFSGAAGNEATFPPNGQPANGTIGSMKRGSGITPSAAGNVFAATGFTTNTSVDTADYFSFSIKANQGFKLNLDSIVFGQRRSNSGPASYSVRSSLDGFQNDLGSGSCPTNITYNNRISLGTAFQSVASTVTIDFRFYGYGAGAASGTYRLDSLRIYGSISQGGGVPVIKPKLSFSPVSASFTESNGPQAVTAVLSSAASVSISPSIVVKGGTAASGSDYTGFTSIPLTFSAGSLQQNAQVSFLDDAVQESTETLTLVLRKKGLVSDTAYELGADTLFTFTIQDNDVVVGPSGLLQQFNFTGSAGNEVSFPADGQPANGGIGNMKRGSGVTPSASGNVFASTGFTTNTSVDTADYFSFSIKANQGFKLNLDSIVFGQRRSNSGPANYAVRSSLDGFQADLGLGSSSTTTTWNNKATLGQGFQSIASSQTIDFRFYGYGAGAAGGTWRLDSVRIYGSITQGGVVPVIKPKLSFSPVSGSFTESNGPQSLTAILTSAASVGIFPSIVVKGGTAASGSDYTGFTSIPLTFSAGSLQQNAQVSFLDDAVQESTETLTLVLRKKGLVSDTAYELGADTLFTFTIQDNDVVVGPSGLLQQFNFTGAAGNEVSFPADGQPANGAIGNMKRGSGLAPSAAGNVFASTGFSTSTSVDTADYFSFSIKANQGFKLNLDSIVFGQRRSNSGPANYAVRSSLDGFQADLATGTAASTISYNNKAVLEPDFQALPSSQTVEFRLYGYAASSATGTWRIDSVRVYGSINFITAAQFPQTLGTIFQVFPNPGQTEIFFKGVSVESGPLELSGMDGKVFFSLPSPEDGSKIDVTPLPQGIYFIRNKQTGQTQRWIKSGAEK